jgi:hypothetical protein
VKTLSLALALAIVPCCGMLSFAASSPPCRQTLSDCPLRGCAKANTPDALSNRLKHNREPDGDLIMLDFSDFAALQNQVETLFSGHYATLTKPDRARLQNLQTSHGTVSEGDLVGVTGFVAVKPGDSKPHANASGESVNCRLKGTDNNDFHISITPNSGESEFEGIVVEMVPQARNPDWTTAQLRKAQTEKRRVRVKGQLFFDNHHRVNDDPQHPAGNQPKRFSLWEIHPITAFEVCTQSQCSEGSPAWKPLDQWQ